MEACCYYRMSKGKLSQGLGLDYGATCKGDRGTPVVCAGQWHARVLVALAPPRWLLIMVEVLKGIN